MKLDTWLTKEGVTRAEFAARISTTVQTLSRIIAGKQNISLAMADAIVRETKGAVTAEDLREAFAAQRATAPDDSRSGRDPTVKLSAEAPQ